MSSKKLLTKAASLSDSLDELEVKLEPLLSIPLQENLSSLEKLQQAKLNVLLPYLINDLIFIYLKTRGIDPKTHPVIAELDRVRQYFAKIKDAEDGEKKRTSGIDKAAAGRFIKHAIAQAKQNNDTGSNLNEAGPSQPSLYVPARVTEKMKEREAYLQDINNDSENEEQALEIIGDDTNTGGDTPKKDTNNEQKGKKKRRRPMDPFGPAGDKNMDVDSAPDTLKRSRKLTEVMGEETGTSSRASSVANADDTSITDKKRKKRKKSTKMAQE